MGSTRKCKRTCAVNGWVENPREVAIAPHEEEVSQSPDRGLSPKECVRWRSSPHGNPTLTLPLARGGDRRYS
ncbi:hypothetical protein NG796_00100 [Laspinema sp. A4]|uniref:hypothetical protein n=1 Tax=Laspinema sp. D2d TaxID=2953686 RepID=UPI0021BAE39F|nr:hypothetical protein [Laspinema sp. D2d]MCT7981685.1 hypothetical protein [Laspinema sp. D2d]